MQHITLITLFWLSASVAMAQQISGIKLNPGERIIAINGVPVVDGKLPATSTVAGGAVITASATEETEATNIVGQLVRSDLPFSHTPGATALQKANHERRLQGQGPLLPDPQLQQLALQKATIAAQRRHKNHIGGSQGGASCEGVAHTAGRFLACCLDKPGTHGGAAMVQGVDGWYCCLLVR
jgi:hypothetical protein